MEIGIGYGLLCDPIEKQVNRVGYTLGEFADKMENLRKSINMLGISGVLTESQVDVAFKRLHKKIIGKLVELENFLDENGLNKSIQSHILSDDEMLKAGFKRTDNSWSYFKMIEFPDEKKFENLRISFNVSIPKDGSRLRIDVLDDDYLQPYDYQKFLQDPNNTHKEVPSIVNRFVENEMKKLQEAGILSGHEPGDYI